MAKKTAPKNSEDAVMAAAGDGITYAKAYQKVSDLPSDDVVWLLPKDDYRNACYVWQVPNGEVTIPGTPFYRMPARQSVLTSDFGFMPSDTFEDFDVFAVSDCSDWQAYVQKRESGQWKEEEEKIERLLQQAVPVQSTAPAPTPAAWNWSDCTRMMGQFTVRAASGASDDVQTAVTDANQLIACPTSGCAAPINGLCPSLSLTFSANGEPEPQGSGEWFVTTPTQIQALAAALGWTSNETILERLYSFYNGNTNPYSPYINLKGTILTSSMGTYTATNGTVLSSSNCTLTFTLQQALNHSIADFAY